MIEWQTNNDRNYLDYISQVNNAMGGPINYRYGPLQPVIMTIYSITMADLSIQEWYIQGK